MGSLERPHRECSPPPPRSHASEIKRHTSGAELPPRPIRLPTLGVLAKPYRPRNPLIPPYIGKRRVRWSATMRLHLVGQAGVPPAVTALRVAGFDSTGPLDGLPLLGGLGGVLLVASHPLSLPLSRAHTPQPSTQRDHLINVPRRCCTPMATRTRQGPPITPHPHSCYRIIQTPLFPYLHSCLRS